MQNNVLKFSIENPNLINLADKQQKKTLKDLKNSHLFDFECGRENDSVHESDDEFINDGSLEEEYSFEIDIKQSMKKLNKRELKSNEKKKKKRVLRRQKIESEEEAISNNS